MKRVVFIVILFAACTFSSENGKMSERELIVLNKIKCIKEYSTAVHLGIADKEHLHRLKLFNAKGLITKETVMNDTGVAYTTTNEYDKNDNQIISNVIGSNGRVISIYKRTFNDKNNLTELLHFEAPDKPYLIGYRTNYDDKGRKIETVGFTPIKPMTVEKYKYDGMNIVEDVERDTKGSFIFRWTKKYDKAGNLIEMVQYFPDSITVNSKITYQYNKDNELVKETTVAHGFVQRIDIYQYDNKHLLTAKIEYSSPGEITGKYRYEYEYF